MTLVATDCSIAVSAQQLQDLPANLVAEQITESEVHLRLLSLLEQNPDWTQRQIANTLGVSLGKINYCLRALRDKGLVKWGNFSQNPNKVQYLYLLTPKGITQKAQITTHFLRRKEYEFEELRSEIARLRAELGLSNPDPGVITPQVDAALKYATFPLGQTA